MALLKQGTRRVGVALSFAPIVLLALLGAARTNDADQRQSGPGDSLKLLSLEVRGNIEVTTLATEPEEIRRAPAAVYVSTQDDIRRSGVTSFPEILRLAPGVDVGASIQITGVLAPVPHPPVYFAQCERTYSWKVS